MASIIYKRMPTETVKRGAAKETVQQLNTLVGRELTLYLTTWNYHWNIIGPHFHSIHLMLEEQYNVLKTQIDEVAERVRMLGGVAETKVDLHLANLVSAKKTFEDLLHEHESIATQIGDELIPAFEKAEDDGTVDLLTGLIQIHEKYAWMLRASLEK